MKTIEFTSKVKNGTVKIPDKGNALENNEVKVVLTWLLSEIKRINIFRI
ncbi:MAG: hypothetical protein ABI462_14990 [Ignavibacteria bacterium]